MDIAAGVIPIPRDVIAYDLSYGSNKKNCSKYF